MADLEQIKLRVEQVRQREEARLIMLAKKSGIFDSKFTSIELETLFRDYVKATLPKNLSQLAKLELKMKTAKKAQSEQERREDARRKILMGSFIIAQMEHKPVLRTELTPELVQFLELHKDPKAVERNKELLKEWLVPVTPEQKPNAPEVTP